MPIIHVTKQQVDKAQQAYKKALTEDAEFKKFEEAQEKEFEEALKQAHNERKEDMK